MRKETEKELITRVEGRPYPASDTQDNKNNKQRWRTFKKFFSGLFDFSNDTGQQYLKGKSLEAVNTAEKIAEEAAEISARKRETDVKTEIAQQELVEKFINNIERISRLPKELQPIAFAKLAQQDPDILTKQAALIIDKIEYLRAVRGTSITAIPEQESNTKTLDYER